MVSEQEGKYNLPLIFKAVSLLGWGKIFGGQRMLGDSVPGK